MSQSRSQGRRAPTSSGSQPEVSRGGGLDSTSRSQHSQSIEDIKDDFGALLQEVDRLENEVNNSNDEYNSLVSKAVHTYDTSTSKIYTYHLAKLYNLLEKSEPEDTKKQEHEELVSAVQNQIGEIKRRAREIEAKRLGKPWSNAIGAMKRIKANAVREKPEEIEKLNGTPEGTQVVEDSNTKLTGAFELFQKKVLDIDKQYSEKTSKVFERHKEIEKILNKKNIPKFPENRAEAFARTGSRDLQELLKEKKKNVDNKRRKLLKK